MYGDLLSSTANQASYPTLSPVQIDKLKQLSLVSLGMESRVRGSSSLNQIMMTDDFSSPVSHV
jgi:hypothetical protein